MGIESTLEPANWKEEVAQNWANVRLGHEGMMLDKIGMQIKRLFQTADAAANGTLGSGKLPEAEDMAVTIGNKIYNIHEAAKPSVMPSVIKKGLPLALAAVLGGGAMLAVPLLLDWWNKPAPPVATQPGEDWQLGIEVINP